MGKGNEVLGMRLAPEVVERIDQYNQKLMWKPGQLFTALLDSEDRMQKALKGFQPGILDDGRPVIMFTDSCGEKDILFGEDMDEPFHWLVSELQKPLTLRFLEPFSSGSY